MLNLNLLLEKSRLFILLFQELLLQLSLVLHQTESRIFLSKLNLAALFLILEKNLKKSL